MKKKKHGPTTKTGKATSRKKVKTKAVRKKAKKGGTRPKKGNKGATKKIADVNPQKKLTQRSRKIFKNSGVKRPRKGSKKVARPTESQTTTNRRHAKTVRGPVEASIKKIRGQHLFYISLNQKGFQNKVLAVQRADFSPIQRYIDKLNDIPINSVITFKVKKPDTPGHYYMAQVSPADMHIDASNLKQWLAELLADYNNNMLDLIDEIYDEQISPYNIVAATIRLNFQ